MAGIERVTRQLLDLLFVLLDACLRGEELDGYAIKKRAGLSGPSTYRGLDRLEDAHRRCYYRLNPEGVATARALHRMRRPEVLERLGRTPHVRSPVPKPGFGARFAAVMGLAGGSADERLDLHLARRSQWADYDRCAGTWRRPPCQILMTSQQFPAGRWAAG